MITTQRAVSGACVVRCTAGEDKALDSSLASVLASCNQLARII